MSLEKAISSGKERRKPYRGAKAMDPACRNHGADEWSKQNRLIQRTRAEDAARAQMECAEEDIDE